MKEKINEIIEKRKKLHIEDDFGIQKCWEELSNIFSVDENKTISYLNSCEKEELYWISEALEDISEKLESKNFIMCLRNLNKRFPELEMTKDIDLAEEYTM